MRGMSERHSLLPTVDRRGFFWTAGAGIAAATLSLGPKEAAAAQAAAWTEKDKLARIASCSWPIRFIFKTRGDAGRGGGGGRGTVPPPTNRGNAGVSPQEMKEKYGEITMLDF